MESANENTTNGKVGRPKGSLSKTTEKTRSLMGELLELALDEVKLRLPKMKDRDLVEIVSIMARHTTPVPKEDNQDGTTDTHIKFTGKLLQ